MKIPEVTIHGRESCEELLFEILNPLKPNYSEEKSELFLGATSTHYENRSIPMEAFVRPLWGLVPFWAGGGSTPEFEEIYRRGLAAGTNPESPGYWGGFRDLDQKFVEMAGIAYAMLLAPEKIWNTLSPKEQDHLAAWLDAGINHYECSDSNWQFFCILTNVALKTVGKPYSRERMERGISRINHFYQGDGWYTDGEGGQQDYYIGMAFHFYGLIYSMFMQDSDPEQCEEFKTRARLFAKDFIFMFADNGSAVPYGRSLTYRFAEVGFFSACVMSGLDVYPLPVLKGLIFRHLRYWMDQPICDNAGILTIGYAYPNLSMSEGYNAPGSPYWCMKAFAFLALPKEHEFWKVEEAPLPKLPMMHPIKAANMLVQRIDGHVYLYVPGRTQPHQFAHVDAKYSKFVYSTKYGFSISRSQRSLKETAPDSMLAFEVFGHLFVKEIIGEHQVSQDRIYVEWSPLPGIFVKTEIIPDENGHLRRHEIESQYECTAYECGFAVNCDACEDIQKITGTETGTEILIEPEPNTNLLCSKTIIPAITYKIQKGKTRIETRIDVRKAPSSLQCQNAAYKAVHKGE